MGSNPIGESGEKYIDQSEPCCTYVSRKNLWLNVVKGRLATTDPLFEMLYYCQDCGTFSEGRDTPTKLDYDKRYPICPVCGEYVMDCRWFLTGMVHYPHRVVSSNENVERLGTHCTTCGLRYKCWTGN